MPAAAYAEMEAFIRQEAVKRGIDPDVAVKVAQTEALNVFDPSKPDRGGDDGSSFGPFQLHYAGMSAKMPNAGLGDDFTAKTGLDARDPSTWKQQVVFSLDHAAKDGWRKWMGARDNGIPDFAGISGRSPNAGAVAPGVATPATSTGSAPAGTTLVNPTTNEAAPYKLGEALAPAVVIAQQPAPIFPDLAKDANPWSSLSSAMAASLDPNKAQFLSGGNGEQPPAPPLEFTSAVPVEPAPALPDLDTGMAAGADGAVSPLGGLFQLAGGDKIGAAGIPKLDQYGRPIQQRTYG